jgi:hypothetical protein
MGPAIVTASAKANVTANRVKMVLRFMQNYLLKNFLFMDKQPAVARPERTPFKWVIPTENTFVVVDDVIIKISPIGS